jgi:transposase-like protein
MVKRYPAIGQAWRRAWEYVVPFFALAPGICRMIYTTAEIDVPLRGRPSRRSAAHRLKASPGGLIQALPY